MGFFALVLLVGASNVWAQASGASPGPQSQQPAAMVSRPPSPGSAAAQVPQPTLQAAEAIKDSFPWKDMAPVIAACITGLVSLIVLGGTGLIAFISLRAGTWQKANEAEVKEIDEKLNKFYGRFMHSLGRTHLFAQDVRSKQPDPKNYRLLVQLFDAKWKDDLSAADKALVTQIVEAAEANDALISENLGMADPMLIPYFVCASAHFRILKLAGKGELGKDSKPFESYVYPKALDHVVNLEVTRLVTRREKLLANLSKNHGAMPKLQIPLKEEKYKLVLPPDPDGRLLNILEGFLSKDLLRLAPTGGQTTPIPSA